MFTEFISFLLEKSVKSWEHWHNGTYVEKFTIETIIENLSFWKCLQYGDDDDDSIATGEAK